MNSLPFDTPSPVSSPASAPPPRVPDHELLRCIGHGAYGEVWLARSVPGAYRAVKMVYRRNFEHERPFEREFDGILKFEPLSRKHDSQVDILHVGRGDDHFYYVMELADDQATGGQILDATVYKPRTLKSDLVFRGRLPFEECVQIGVALATALECLHENGLVHRDVKPSNIIFVNGVPKLADIGLVTSVDATRSYVGTEGFAAPEGPGSPQADLYSLGKVLYEISTGKDRQEFPELPTQLRELPDREGLIELNAVIAKACRHDPKDRYASAGAMRTDLELLQSGKSLARLHRLEKRLRAVRRFSTAVAAVAVLSLAAWLWQSHQTQQVRELAAAKTRLADEKAKLADENRERLVRLDIANGVRLLDEGDAPGALLWFAEALPLVTNKPAEETIHRIRIQQTFFQTPRLLQVMAHESSVMAGAFSPDSRYIATGTMDGRIRVWDMKNATTLWPPLDIGMLTVQARFSPDGRRLLLSSSPPQECSAHGHPPANYVGVLDVATGHEIFPKLTTNVVWSTFSPDGRWLVAAMSDHIIRLFDTNDGRLLTELRGHNEEVCALSFSADASLLASASLDRTARLWRLPSGESLGQALQHEKPVRRAMLSDDGQRLVTSTESESPEGECVIQAWDTKTGQKLGPAFTESVQVNGLFFDRPSGRRLFVAGRDPQIRVWDTLKHTEALPPLEMRGEIACWSLQADGSLLAAGSDDHRARIWSLDDGELFSPPFRHSAWVHSVCFSPDRKKVLTTGNEGTAKVWALVQNTASADSRLDAPIQKQLAQYVDRDIVPRPGPIPIFTIDGSLRLFDPDRLVELHRFANATADQPPNRCATAPNGHQWAVFHSDKRSGQCRETVELWADRDVNATPKTLRHPGGVSTVAFSPDGAHVFTAGRDGQIRLWRTSDGTLEKTTQLPTPTAQVWSFTSDVTKALLVLERSGPSRANDLLQVFDLESGKTLGTQFTCPAGEDFAFDPKGERVATASQDSYVRVFDAHTGKLVSPSFKHPGVLLSLEWSPDGQRVLAAGGASEALISDAATGEQYLSPLKTGTHATVIARWSLDGRFIATRSNDYFARAWDAATGEPITPLLPHRGYVRLACITPNGRLITASDPNRLRAWDLTGTGLPADVIANYARLISGRRLNAAGVMLPIRAEELPELCRLLQQRVPELFE